VLPAAALQPCTLPGALPHAAAVDALNYMLCAPPSHSLLPSTFPFFSNHPAEPYRDSKATAEIICWWQQRWTRAFMILIFIESMNHCCHHAYLKDLSLSVH
jgi:hypothetical protein